MKRYWQFLVVGVICLLAALLWAQPSREPARRAAAVTAQASPQPAVKRPAFQGQTAAAPAPKNSKDKNAAKDDNDDPLPGSSSSLPLLAVIGFGVLAGGITSAMRTRE